VAQLIRILSVCFDEAIPFFPLGEGANILVADRGIDGVVIDMSRIDGIEQKAGLVEAGAGTPLTRVTEYAAETGLAGLENFYSMPGSVGGSIWMNARCYGISLSEVIEYVDILDKDLKERRVRIRREDFGYKQSPFQESGDIILRGGFRLKRGDPSSLKAKMGEFKRDREKKGHFFYPSAGSVFKNDPAFGMPTGQLVDSLGLKGLALGDARVSEAHANIIVNCGSASARDVRSLIELVQSRVQEKYGFRLKEELLYVGRWEEKHE
jgi:UDP-N-acetylmuramate dehydrogenase